jgi:hypothetical protein
MPVIPARWRLKQEDGKFEGSLGNVGRPCLKKKKVGKRLKQTFSPQRKYTNDQ